MRVKPNGFFETFLTPRILVYRNISKLSHVLCDLLSVQCIISPIAIYVPSIYSRKFYLSSRYGGDSPFQALTPLSEYFQTTNICLLLDRMTKVSSRYTSKCNWVTVVVGKSKINEPHTRVINHPLSIRLCHHIQADD